MERNLPNAAQPEATPAQNWRTLLIAILLGLVVAVIYNVHIRQVRQEGKGDLVTVLKVNKDLNVGDQLKPEFIDDVQVRAEFAKDMKMLLKSDESYVKDAKRVLNVPLKRDAYLTWDLMEQIDMSRRPSASISEGMVAVPMQLDPKGLPGELLRPGDHVNIIGIVNVGGKLATYRIIEGVRVLEVGYRVEKDKSAGGARAMDVGLTNYREIGIELSLATSLEFKSVLTHAMNVSVEVRNPEDKFPANPQINKDLKALASSPSGGGPGGPTGGPEG